MSKSAIKLILYGILISAILLLFVQQNSIQNKLVPLAVNTALRSEQEQVNPLLPVRLKIPKIKADAIVEYVGLTPEGRMDVPKGPAEVAWYKLGPRPGEI